MAKAAFARSLDRAYIVFGDSTMTAKHNLNPSRSLNDSNSALLATVRSGSAEWKKTALKSPEHARDALKKMGMLTPTGRLTKHYK